MRERRKPIQESTSSVRIMFVNKSAVKRERGNPGPEERLRPARERWEERRELESMFPMREAIPAVLSDTQVSVSCSHPSASLDVDKIFVIFSDEEVNRSVRVSTQAFRSGGCMVFLRGASGWAPEPENRSAHGWKHSRGHTDVQRANVRYVLNYDPATNVLNVNGADVALDEGNVVLVDRIDGVGGPPVVRRVGCVALSPADSSWRHAIESIPEVKAFVSAS